MLMPETSVHEDHFLLCWENDVRVARQTFAMETIAITQTKEKAPNLKFRRHVLASDATHVLAAAFW
jgi:hypothetical protein